MIALPDIQEGFPSVVCVIRFFVDNNSGDLFYHFHDILLCLARCGAKRIKIEAPFSSPSYRRGARRTEW